MYRESFITCPSICTGRDRPVPSGAFKHRKCPRVVARGLVCFSKPDHDDEPSRQESTDAQPTHHRDTEAVAKRVSRALDGFYHVEAAGDDGEYTVFSESGSTYTVNLPAGTCTCPDGQRGSWCKHAHRAAFVTGDIPAIDGVHVAVDTTDEPEFDGEEPDTEATETLAERVERFEANNPGASAIEAISQLGIDPGQKERVEEVLA